MPDIGRPNFKFYKSWLTFTGGSSNLTLFMFLSRYLLCVLQSSSQCQSHFGTLRKISYCEIRRGCPWYKRLLDLADDFPLPERSWKASAKEEGSTENKAVIWKRHGAKVLQSLCNSPLQNKKSFYRSNDTCAAEWRALIWIGWSFSTDVCPAFLRMPCQGLFNSCCPLGFLDGEEKKNYTRHYKRHRSDSDFKNIFHGQSTGRIESERTLQINESLNVWKALQVSVLQSCNESTEFLR